MRLSLASSSLITLFCAPWALGFGSLSTPRRCPHTALSMSDSLTAAEEAALRAGAGAAALRPVPPPKLFEDDLLNDMQQCLLKLERRVNDGPGALSMLEVEEFEHATKRILQEMKLNEHNRPKPAPAFPEGLPTATGSVVEDTPAVATTGSVVPDRPEPVVANTDDNYANGIDISNDDGPAYDGTGGMGLSKGTVNTYVIPGMDEMSPDEYQKALQASISNRQANRVASGTYGNRGSTDYLNNLSQGSSGTGMVKKD
ncbi:expressed unknown protein [Seminavis robusta]|uniref:Uncharacterized protein n=1 Tax=Seminavis robusta TaxID=568900 RepID=A0A9N8H811_9STRA|nr:expressed unknown protein [Seminavis robusta]|eukprot:Sro200_g084860.1 n/a (257) ;mRNA; f:73407-74177